MVLTGSGCSSSYAEPDCPPGTEFSVDNRNRDYPYIDQDWLCFQFTRTKTEPPVEPFVPPDVSTVNPADPSGPKDPDSVVNAAIAHIACYLPDPYGTVNDIIGRLYVSKPYAPVLAALAERTACFKNMTEGCETYRKCMGIATSTEVMVERAPPCKDGVAYRQFTAHSGYLGHMWANCAGLGFECQIDLDAYGFGYCEYPNKRDCDITEETSACVDSSLRTCLWEAGSPTNGSMVDLPRCADYGLECNEDSGYFPAYCKGTGVSCSYDPPLDHRPIFEYGDGSNCESDTLMRACVGGGETIVDCASFGRDFKCQQMPGWAEASCGFAQECYDNQSPKCEGSSLVVCDAGRIRKVDCKALGFNSCNAGYGFCE